MWLSLSDNYRLALRVFLLIVHVSISLLFNTVRYRNSGYGDVHTVIPYPNDIPNFKGVVASMNFE